MLEDFKTYFTQFFYVSHHYASDKDEKPENSPFLS